MGVESLHPKPETPSPSRAFRKIPKLRFLGNIGCSFPKPPTKNSKSLKNDEGACLSRLFVGIFIKFPFLPYRGTCSYIVSHGFQAQPSRLGLHRVLG